MQFGLFLLAVVLTVVNALSLLAKAESIRGSGRVCGGIATVILGAFMMIATYSAGQFPAIYGLPSAVLAVAGLLGVGSGVRKFLRRNADVVAAGTARDGN